MTEILISNDSGPVHVAAGYKTNTLVLFGPETPVNYALLNPNARIIYKELYCSPCINILDNKSFENCTDPKCMNMISIKETLGELKKYFLGKHTVDWPEYENERKQVLSACQS